jgi:glucosamine--fructose-6-phosphate aminotransferase (isomerizing)
MHTGEGDRLVGARKDVPLLVGLGDGESFLASDRRRNPRPHRSRVFLEDGDVADLRPWGVTLTDVAGAPVERDVTTIDWSPEAAEKGGYPHFMLKEINEQPESLSQSIAGRVDRDDRIRAEELEGIEDAIRAADRVEIVACGSAYYASLVGAAAVQGWTGLPARATVGSEFRYAPPPLGARTLVIAVTQSGETADTIAPTRLARDRGCTVIAVTNTVGSAITREADAVLFLQAGPEIAVAASKTFVTQVTTLVILAAAIAKIRGTLAEDEEAELGAALRALPSPRPARWRPRPRPHPSSRAAMSTRAGSCSSAAARRIRPPSRAPSSSRRSATSTPRATRRVSSSTGRSRCWTPSVRSSPSRRDPPSTTS